MKLSIVVIVLSICFPVSSAQGQGPINPVDSLPNRSQLNQVDTIAIPSVSNPTALDEIEIDKLIIDETISKAGYDFIEIFFAQWNWPPLAEGSFIIVITERPFRGISTQLVITVNDLQVFDSFLQTRYEYLESIADIAIEQTIAYIVNYEDIIRQLGGEDISGTGIY